MVLINVPTDAFLATALLVLLPSVYLSRRMACDAPHRIRLTHLLLAHTIYILYILIVLSPPDIFQQLRLPLNAPADKIRATLLARASLPPTTALPRPLETLLTRLSSFDMRTTYVRFGQAVVQDCEHCKTVDEYALFALPRALLQYVREAAVLGLLTIRGSGRERWRTYAVASLVCAAVLEGYWVATVPIQIPRDGLKVFMWHDKLWLARHLLFLALPVVTHLLPAPAAAPTPPPHASLARMRDALGTSLTRLASLRYLRGAALREPALRAAAGAWWARQRREGAWAREDEHVQRVAEQLGRGFREADEARGRAEGRLRGDARRAVGMIREGLFAPL